jgi:ubiquinone biosynthesis protein
MAERRPVVIVAEPSGVRHRYLCLFVSLFRLLWGGLVLLLQRKFTPANRAVLVREFVERMGYLWFKLGQMMAIRTDIYDEEFCRELGKLRNQEIGFPLEVARKVIEEELGRPLEEVFAEFDPVPFRAAFTSQVHRAVLHGDSGWVAVKVQRPGIEPVFRKDMQAIRWMVALFKWLELDQALRWDDGLWDLNQGLTTETDYRYEASNMRRMRRALRKQKIYVPEVHEDLSTRRVLVMEFVRGALMSDVVELTRTDPGRLARWYRENRINPRQVGRRLFVSFLRQLMEDNLLHGNLHPGNIILLRDSRFAFVDLSVLTTVETEFLRRYVQSMRALATYQYGRAAELTLLLCPELPAVDLPMVKEAMIRCFRAWDARSELKRMPYAEKSLANVYSEIGRILHGSRIAPRLNFMKICHTWSTLDDSLSLLIPEANYSALFRKYFRGASRRAFRDALSTRSLLEGVMNLKETVAEYQQLVGPMLRRSALVFQGGTTKLADALASLFRLLRLGTLGGIFVVGLKLVDAIEPERVQEAPVLRRVHELIQPLPLENTDLMVLLLVGLAYLFRMLGKLERRFRQKDVRLPGSSTLSVGN